MNPIVIYSSRKSNTEKVALEIAKELNCKVVKITKDFDASTLPLETYDFVFVGTGIIGGEPYNELLNYLKTVNLNGNNRRFALFMTWAGGGASDKLTYQQMKTTLEALGQNLLKDYFICLGQTFGFTRRGRPNEGDLIMARKWSKETINKYKNP